MQSSWPTHDAMTSLVPSMNSTKFVLQRWVTPLVPRAPCTPQLQLTARAAWYDRDGKSNPRQQRRVLSLLPGSAAFKKWRTGVCSLCATGKYQAGRSPAPTPQWRPVTWRQLRLETVYAPTTSPRRHSTAVGAVCADGAPTVDTGAEFSLAFARPRRSEHGGYRPHLNRVRGHVWRDTVARGGTARA